jgi:predicted nucleic acid-binding protein
VILADTSIVIEWQRIPSITTRRIIAAHDARVCGVTVAEVLTGARNPVERQKTMLLLGAFRRVDVEEPVWELAGDISAGFSRHTRKAVGRGHRRNGHPPRPPPVDARCPLLPRSDGCASARAFRRNHRLTRSSPVPDLPRDRRRNGSLRMDVSESGGEGP